MSYDPGNVTVTDYQRDSLRLEAVTVSVGFDDLLDITLQANHPHLDTLIVVTSMTDTKTKQVCQKHGAICVPTDLIYKNERKFNKGAAINAGFNAYQYYGWRMHIDADIILPDNFRRMFFNHHHRDWSVLYGADRVDVIGRDKLRQVQQQIQHSHGVFVEHPGKSGIGARFIHTLYGYCPLGYFQMWHASCQKPYPYSLGTAAHDDIMFSALWPESHRRVLPGVIVSHLCTAKPVLGENWDGNRKQPRMK